MLHTSEARWFFKGELPNRVVAWFGSDLPQAPEARNDCYLVFPGCDSVGVKLRDTNDPSRSAFEVKARLRGPHSDPVGPAGHGSGRRVGEVERAAGSLPEVGRQHRLIGTDMDHESTSSAADACSRSTDGGPTEVAPDDQPDEGCTFELVNLLAAGARALVDGRPGVVRFGRVGADTTSCVSAGLCSPNRRPRSSRSCSRCRMRRGRRRWCPADPITARRCADAWPKRLIVDFAWLTVVVAFPAVTA